VKKGFFFTVTFFIALASFAQKKNTISGIVTDANTGETLLGANIILL